MESPRVEPEHQAPQSQLYNTQKATLCMVFFLPPSVAHGGLPHSITLRALFHRSRVATTSQLLAIAEPLQKTQQYSARKQQEMRDTRSTVLRVVLLATLVCSHMARGLGLGEPPDGKAYLAAWTDGSAPFLDSPKGFNGRIGQNAYGFQQAQTIPVTEYNYTSGGGGQMNISQVTETGTTAAVFLTVYPQALSRVSDADLQALGQQLARYQTTLPQRPVFLRFAPEMQGRWMSYGAQPTQFLALWKRMFAAVKARAPKTIIVWAPNAAMGYPYGIRLSDVASQADQELLDTNKNGRLDAGDDAYAAYYPGDEYVDWNGISWYWKGSEYPYRVNQLVPGEYSAGAMTGRSSPGAMGTGGAQTFTSFYDRYCGSKPCMFSEMGAAFHVNSSGTRNQPSQEALQQSWWRDSLTSVAFMDRFPKMKMFMLFEHQKPEDGGDLRDYRISINDQVRASWLQDFQGSLQVSSRFIWADNATSLTSPAAQVARGAAPPSKLDKNLMFDWALMR
ncbi:hypothetical protein VP01_1622g2 [Puccinia sorghi]|uniref:GH26 domain-containing protein n=1 Tax=Puccinia sorghi TaxID=27349 RepID=A0A0L6VIT9_9BASI|nr:hypothetical protein VP01_1622g2 [Puccinia sorghi]